MTVQHFDTLKDVTQAPSNIIMLPESSQDECKCCNTKIIVKEFKNESYK